MTHPDGHNPPSPDGGGIPVDGAGSGSGLGHGTRQTAPVHATIDDGALQVSITWYGGCFLHATIYNITGEFQAVDYDMTTTQPLPLEGTLFFAPNCDPAGGTDNMNDYGTPTGTGHMVQGFSHHPDTVPTSAVYWLGDRTADGQCPASGGACSGCVTYDYDTPSCDNLP